MSKYDTFWQEKVEKIFARIIPEVETSFDIPIPELETLGERAASGYNGRLFLEKGKVVTFTDSAVFKSLNDTVTNIDQLSKKVPGNLKIRIYGSVLKVVYRPATSSGQISNLSQTPTDTYSEKKMKNIPLNQILYGPPGTGKTYNTIDSAIEIIRGQKASHNENKASFDIYRKSGQIEFITFHQNYGYEDFVVGLKPDVETERLRFRPYKGIFYEIVKRAAENYYASKENRSIARDFNSVFSEIVSPLAEGKDVEIKMRSGITFSIYDLTSSSILFRKRDGSTIHTLSINTLKELVEGTRTAIPAGLESYYIPLINQLQELRKENTGSTVEERKNFVLIIDEINRANISKVFGELITLLEEDKRIGNPNELKVTLTNGERDFAIPPNLYVIGTMNTADKSIALIDIALRRRFEFIGFYPNYDIPELNSSSIKLLRHINQAIYSKKKSSDYLVGHAYFLNNRSIESILRNKVIPLLMEYFSGKPEIVTEIFAGSDWKVSYSDETFSWEIST